MALPARPLRLLRGGMQGDATPDLYHQGGGSRRNRGQPKPRRERRGECQRYGRGGYARIPEGFIAKIFPRQEQDPGTARSSIGSCRAQSPPVPPDLAALQRKGNPEADRRSLVRSYGGPFPARHQGVFCGSMEGGPAPAGTQRQPGSGKEPEAALLRLCKRQQSAHSQMPGSGHPVRGQ